MNMFMIVIWEIWIDIWNKTDWYERYECTYEIRLGDMRYECTCEIRQWYERYECTYEIRLIDMRDMNVPMK